MTPKEEGTPDPALSGLPRRGRTRFRPHGRIDLWKDGAVVRVTAEGPFNLEAMALFSRKVVALYRQLPPKQRFVNITEFRGSMLATPETRDDLAGHLQRMNRSGLPLVATAWVASADVEGRSLFMPRGEALFRENGRLFAAFETVPEAEDWAHRHLAQ